MAVYPGRANGSDECQKVYSRDNTRPVSWGLRTASYSPTYTRCCMPRMSIASSSMSTPSSES